MGQIKDDMVPFLKAEQIREIVQKLAKQVNQDYKGKEIVLVCPLRGSVHFMADFMRELTMPVIVDFVLLASTSKGGSVQLIQDVSTNVTGKHVIIVEEIIDSGRKLTFLRNRLLASNPASLKILALLDKPARRELPLMIDYTGKIIDDRYLVGYGMDTDNLGRNYPDIYYPKH